MILSSQGLEQAEQNGHFGASDRLDFSAFSLDLRLGRLYREKNRRNPEEDPPTEEEVRKVLSGDEPTAEEYIDEELEEIQIPEEGIIITPEQHYLWQPVEELFLSARLAGRIYSRSTYARLGIRVEEVDDRMHRLGTARTCHPLCTLKSFTNIRIRKYERLAQLFVAYEDYIRPHFMLSDIQEFVRTNQMVFQRKGKAIPPEEIGGVEGALLTMDPRIKIYNGDVIEPGQDNSDKFEEYTLPEEGVFMPNQAFFLSTSDEYVEIPDGKVGFVKEAVAPAEARQMFLTRPAAYQPSPFFSHTNAPFIGSRSVFTGSITFENVMRMDSFILPGMPLSELYLIQATLPPENTQHSRYRGQEGATTGKFTE